MVLPDFKGVWEGQSFRSPEREENEKYLVSSTTDTIAIKKKYVMSPWEADQLLTAWKGALEHSKESRS